MWHYRVVLSQRAELNKTLTPPDALDWRKLGAVTPVKDQTISCGSCWAFASIGALESQHFIVHGQLLNLSQQELVDCSKQSYGCDGGSYDKAFNYVIDEGISRAEDYPYKAVEGECNAENVARSEVKVYGYASIAPNQEAMKAALHQFGPLYASINGMPKSFNFYSEGVYMDPECDASGTNHAIVIVGYGTDRRSKLDYWIAKNSFSSQWGESGYIRLVRNNNVTCGIDSTPAYPLLIDNGGNRVIYPRIIFLSFFAAILLIFCCYYCCCYCYCVCRKGRKRNFYNLC